MFRQAMERKNLECEAQVTVVGRDATNVTQKLYSGFTDTLWSVEIFSIKP